MIKVLSRTYRPLKIYAFVIKLDKMIKSYGLLQSYISLDTSFNVLYEVLCKHF